MATITIRLKAASLDIDTTAQAITGLHVEYDLTVGGLTTPATWSGAPGPALADDLWALLRRYLRDLVAVVGVAPPPEPSPVRPSQG